MKINTLIYCILLILFTRCGPASTPQQAPEVAEAEEAPAWTEEDRRFLLDELDRTTRELLDEVEDLSPDQWNFRENPYRWDISEIVEHLAVQNELDYRELTAAAHFPSLPDYTAITRGQDDYFLKYAADPQKTQAPWYLHPIGRFPHKRAAINAFLRARDGVRDYVEATKVDLRTHFTFRDRAGEKPVTEVKIGEVRDLHQLVLTGIAHTDRHVRQIREVKKNRRYPRNI